MRRHRVARTSKVCGPSPRRCRPSGWRWRSRRRRRAYFVGDAALVRAEGEQSRRSDSWFAAGFVSIVVCGRVRATVTVSMSLIVFRALSVATTLSVQEPSAGIARETEYGAVVSTPIEFCVRRPASGIRRTRPASGRRRGWRR